jgi:hypothetical protein
LEEDEESDEAVSSNDEEQQKKESQWFDPDKRPRWEKDAKALYADVHTYLTE